MDGFSPSCTGGMPNNRMKSIKDPKLYEDLRRDGNSKQKAARISNAVAARGQRSVSRKGGESGSYDDWTVPELRQRAKELGLTGYSGLSKPKLIAKIRES
jgi:hypothetical protein